MTTSAQGPRPKSDAALPPVSAQIALRALSRNRLRTALTMLGVIIGVAAVIAMVALGIGRARLGRDARCKSAGTNIIQVSAGNFTRGGESMNIASGLGSATTLTLEDADAIRAHRRRAARGRRRPEPRVREVAAPAVLHAGPRRASRRSADIHGWEWLGGRVRRRRRTPR